MDGIKINYKINKYLAMRMSDLASFTLLKDSLQETNSLGVISLDLSDDLFSLIVKNNEEEIEFGEYPQGFVDQEEENKLESIYKSGSMFEFVTTGQKYNIMYTKVIKKLVCKTWSASYYNDFCHNTIDSCNVYLYGGQKYIRYIDRKNNKPVWFKIEPIKWKVNKHKKCLTSEIGFLNGPFESYKYDASCWSKDLTFLIFTRLSDKKTKKYIEKYVLKDILQTVRLEKTIECGSFEELVSIIKEHNNFIDFQGLVKVKLKGPALTKREKRTINELLGNKIEKSFVYIELDRETTFDKFKLKKAKKEIESDTLAQKIKDVFLRLEDFKKSVESLEGEKDYSLFVLNNILSSVKVPRELLIIEVDDHYEFNPEFIPILKFIDLSLLDTINLKLSGLDLRNTNIQFDPQLIYKKDLSGSKLSDNNVIWKSFKGVDLRGAELEQEEESYDLEYAITDENTRLPIRSNKAL